MSNFDWEQIEKDAARKKLIILGTAIIIVVSVIVLFTVNFKSDTQKSIIPENIITIKDTAENEINKHEELELAMQYTVKIGRFSDFSAARDFILSNSIRDFNLYRENGDIYVNLGIIKSYEKAQESRDYYIKNGFPAIVEIYEEKQVEDFNIELSENQNIEEDVNIEQNEKQEEELSEPENQVNTQVNQEFVSDKKDISAGWTIQVAAFKDIKDANFLKNTLRFDGIESTIVKEDDYFKVWVGVFETREQAQENSKKIDSKKVTGFYIRRTKR